jgi:hypothetical protein
MAIELVRPSASGDFFQIQMLTVSVVSWANSQWARRPIFGTWYHRVGRLDRGVLPLLLASTGNERASTSIVLHRTTGLTSKCPTKFHLSEGGGELKEGDDFLGICGWLEGRRQSL